MPFHTKALWVEDLTTSPGQANDPNLTRLLGHISATGVNLICVRTSAAHLADLIPTFKQLHLKVYAWRWPHARPNSYGPAGDSAYAPNETNTVLNLISKGLDGYIFDIESENDGAANDWDSKGPANRAQVATTMVNAIAGAFRARGTSYTLGLTSHQWGFSDYQNIPWQAFLNECNVLFPQTYWRRDTSSSATKACQPEADDYSTGQTIGTPEQALYNGFTDYANKRDKNGKVLPIIPVGGEIGCLKSGEATHFGNLVTQRGLTEVHFYVDVDQPGLDPNTNGPYPGVLNEIKAL
jgi:hypothetical protein